MAFEADIQRIQQIKSDLLRTQSQRLLAIAFDVSALIKLRIQTTGENSQNQKLPYYTPFTVKSRKAKGYQVGYVDYTQTGQLWASVGPRLISEGGGLCKVVIESRNQRGKDILTKAESKWGNLLLASDEELKIAQESYTRGIENVLNF